MLNNFVFFDRLFVVESDIMKKYFVLGLLPFVLCGCSVPIIGNNETSVGTTGQIEKKKVVNGKMECVTDDSSFVLELSDGQIVRYIDSIDGELSQETVDILNEEHLVGVTDNATAVSRMNEGLKDLGGHCE
jgi:hypothetical protein